MSQRLRHSRGVTLIEMMVGLVVGLLAVLVIAQALSFTEGQKRTTITGTDAQVNGALALHAVSRDVQMAGYGLTNSASALGCEIRASNDSGATTQTLPLAPVVITDGANGAPDTIQILDSNKPYAVPYRVTEDHPRTAANFFLGSALGIAVGDLMLAVPATIDANNWCTLFNVTGANGNGSSSGNGNGNGSGNGGNGNGQGQNQIIHNSGSSGVWNQPGGQTLFPAAGYPAGSYLVNLGQFVQRLYAIQNESLTLTTRLWSTQVTAPPPDNLFPDIVQLQAMYGKDTNNDGVIDTWDNTTPLTNDNAAWKQVLAVRIALVARSDTFEKTEVTTANPLWDVGKGVTVNDNTLVDCNQSKCIALDVGAGVAGDARHYRYKVFDIIVPLRNMLWKS
ncbi:MAG: PilW family protein [Variovorax sp.]|nr:PilW family protein [Variovorax sp.]